MGLTGNFGENHVTPRGLQASMLNKMVCIDGIITKRMQTPPLFFSARLFSPFCLLALMDGHQTALFGHSLRRLTPASRVSPSYRETSKAYYRVFPFSTHFFSHIMYAHALTPTLPRG